MIKNLEDALKKMGVNDVSVELEKPANPEFGDYSSNIALKLTKELKKNPYDIAQEIVKNLEQDKNIEKVTVVKPGFINFTISPHFYLSSLDSLSKGAFVFSPFHFGPQKKLMIEFAHPNTHKLFHIGHLRNISIGESLVRIFEATGNKVIRTNYQGDIGLHIAKCLWFVKYKTTVKELDEIRKKSIHDRMLFLGKAYAAGQVAYDESEEHKQQIIQINGSIYKNEGEIIPLWDETRKWSYDYFAAIYERLYSTFDRLYPESEFANRGVELCKIAEKKGILVQSEGALVFNGKPYGLDTRVFINSLGYPTYEGKEIALAEKEFSEFGELDKGIHVVTPEQKSFFKVTFKVEELLDEKKFKNKQYHLAYEWVKLKEGKMSSRTGNVVEAETIINEAKKQIQKKFECDEETAETLAIAAVKYSFLKSNVFAQIAFDMNESLSLEGNSGPYILYTYVRTQSVLKKASNKLNKVNSPAEPEELALLKLLGDYQSIVYTAAKSLAPNLIANYLYSLAQQYNFFYQKCTILDKNEEVQNLRLTLTKATGIVLKNGLYLLGIKTVEKM